MAVSIWFIIIGILASIIVGAVIIFILYTIIDYFYLYKIRKNIPKDKEKLKDAGNEQIDIKEVIDDEQRADRKYREFEKLRRFAERDRKKGTSIKSDAGANGLQPGQLLPFKPDNDITADTGNTEGTTGNVKEGFKLTRPDDL